MSYNGSNNILVNSISLHPSNIGLEAGDKYNAILATISPSNATNKTLSWRSNNPAVASVSNGIITANSSGNATITATSTDGGEVAATCSVTVTGVALVKSI